MANIIKNDTMKAVELSAANIEKSITSNNEEILTIARVLEDPLSAVFEIDSSSDEENLANLKRSVENNNKNCFYKNDVTCVDTFKQQYKVKKGKIVQLKEKIKTKSSQTISVAKNDQLKNKCSKSKRIRKPNALQRLMAQIDAQLAARGLPVPKDITFNENVVVETLNERRKDDVKKLLCSFNQNAKCFTDEQDEDFEWPLEIKEESSDKKESFIDKLNDAKNDKIENDEEKNDFLDVSDCFDGDSNDNDDLFTHSRNKADANCNDGGLFVESEEFSVDFTSKGKIEIMQSNDGSFVQYKVYDKFDDFVNENVNGKKEDFLVTSAVQIEKCKKLQGNLKINKINIKKKFDNCEDFVKRYRQCLKSKLRRDSNKIGYVYDGNNFLCLQKINNSKNDDFPIKLEKNYDILNDECLIRNCVDTVYDGKTEINDYETLDPNGCEQCEKSFKNKNSLKEHNKTAHLGCFTNDLYICDLCGGRFDHKKLLTDHIKLKHNISNNASLESNLLFDCKKCYRTFRFHKELKTHLKKKNCMKYVFRCEVCILVYKKLNNLLRHVYRIHLKQSSKRCFKKYAKTRNVKSLKDSTNIEHETIKNERIKENVDKKLVISNSTSVLMKDCTVVIDKLKTNDIFSTFNDQETKNCVKWDRDRYLLNKITVATKSGDKLDLYKCDTCPKVFATTKSLCDHTRRVHTISHINDPNYTYVCKLCMKAYMRSADLLRHATLCHKVIIRRKKHEIGTQINGSKCDDQLVFNGDAGIFDEVAEFKKNCDFDGCGVDEASFCTMRNAWICDFCDKSFDTDKKLRDHRRRVHLRRPVKLQLKTNTKESHTLQKLFEEKMAVNECTNDNGDIQCRHCQQAFKDFVNLNQHVSLHHPADLVNSDSRYPHCCQPCKKVFVNSVELVKHARDVHCITLKDVEGGRNMFICDSCPKQFQLKQSLKIHVETVHLTMINGSVGVRCSDGCNKTFESREKMEKHIKLWEPFKCPSCPKHFRSQTALDKHLICHTRQRQFTCGKCGKSYMQRHHMLQHELTHGEGTHPCPQCPMVCFTQSQLRKHLRRNTHRLKSKTKQKKKQVIEYE